MFEILLYSMRVCWSRNPTTATNNIELLMYFRSTKDGHFRNCLNERAFDHPGNTFEVGLEISKGWSGNLVEPSPLDRETFSWDQAGQSCTNVCFLVCRYFDSAAFCDKNRSLKLNFEIVSAQGCYVRLLDYIYRHIDTIIGLGLGIGILQVSTWPICVHSSKPQGRRFLRNSVVVGFGETNKDFLFRSSA